MRATIFSLNHSISHEDNQSWVGVSSDGSNQHEVVVLRTKQLL